MNGKNLRREKFLSRIFSARLHSPDHRPPECWRTLFWLVFWLAGIPVGMIGYLSMLLWAYGVTG
jgi:hypothetical protein